MALQQTKEKAPHDAAESDYAAKKRMGQDHMPCRMPHNHRKNA